MQSTSLQQILKDIGNFQITKDTKLPVLIPGLVRTNFGIAERRVDFKQVCLAAYWLKNVADIGRYEYQIKNELRQHQVKILPYPFETKEALIDIIKELGKHFNCNLKNEEVLSKQNSSSGEFGKYYLFVVLIPSFFYH